MTHLKLKGTEYTLKLRSPTKKYTFKLIILFVLYMNGLIRINMFANCNNLTRQMYIYF
jgi:hypothetical protein